MKTFKISLFSVVLIISLPVFAANSKVTPVVKATRLLKKVVKNRVALSEMKIKNVQFKFNSKTISEDDKNNLNRICKLMTDNKAALKMGGYTDSKGSYLYNWKLSKERVDAVKTYMVSMGADSSRIAATEYGETKPIADNTTIQGRKKNRRVELQFVD